LDSNRIVEARLSRVTRILKRGGVLGRWVVLGRVRWALRRIRAVTGLIVQ